MINNRIFDAVYNFTVNKFGKDFSHLQMVFGYVKLITMDNGILEQLFSADEEKKEIAGIISLFEKNGLQIDELKKAIPVISADASAKPFEEAIDEMRKKNESVSALDVLRQIFESNIPELELLKKGATASDILEFKAELANGSDKKDESDSSISLGDMNKFQRIVATTNKLTSALSSYVYDQTEAISDFTKIYFQSNIVTDRASDSKAPMASFAFVGPTGVGKSHFLNIVANTLHMTLVDYDFSKLHINLEKLMEDISKKIEENPRSIFCFKNHDEISSFINKITDVINGDSQYGDFSNSILVFETNRIGSLGASRAKLKLARTPKDDVVRALTMRNQEDLDYTKLKLYDNIGSENIIVFNHLSFDALSQIAKAEIKKVGEKFTEQNGYEIEFDEDFITMLLFSQKDRVNGKNINEKISSFLRKELFEFGRHITNAKNDLSNIEKFVLKLQIPEIDEKVTPLFKNVNGNKILYIGYESDLADIPFSKNTTVVRVETASDAIYKLQAEEFSLALINPNYKVEQTTIDFLSLDDRRSEGIKAFYEVKSKLPNFSVYFLDNNDINVNEEIAFVELGVDGFIELNDKVEFAEEIEETCNLLYSQHKLIDTAVNSRVLSFNTSQKIVDDGKTAEIIFYDFKLNLVLDPKMNDKMLSEDRIPKDRFKDVIGAEDAIEELKYFADRLKDPRKYLLKGQKAPKGIILYGPPGTGKTMLARAMAGECQIPFFAKNATEFAASYVGDSEKNIRELFQAARDVAPSIIFIDEVDTIAKPRTGSETGRHDEKMLNALLTEIDGFDVDPLRPVFVIVATNFGVGSGNDPKNRGKLDDAFVRRFDNKIYVDLPKEHERAKFLRLLLSNYNLDEFADAIDNFAKRSDGLSCAIIQVIINTAIRRAEQAGKKLSPADLVDSLDQYNLGDARKSSREYFHSVAIHESGHAYICHLSRKEPEFVTITSRGDYGGYMQSSVDEENPSSNKEDYLWRIRCSLAGRISEIEFFGEEAGINSGYSGDIQNATTVALYMIGFFGMDEDIAYALPDNISMEAIISSPVAADIMKKVNECIKNEIETVKCLVHEGRDKIERLAAYLEQNNQATRKEIISILDAE